jgi:thiamine-phosphate pyrophosphorylase
VSVRVVVVTDRATCPIDEMLAKLARILAAAPRNTVRVQVREKDLDGGKLLGFVRDAIALARPLGAEVWVNERVDVAAAAGADGVHLPERGMSIAEARATLAAMTLPDGGSGVRVRIGCSRHSVGGALEAAHEGADVVHLGPIWATPSKAGVIEPLGLAPLAARLDVPLVAIGGIDSPERAREAARAGARAVAVIRAAWASADPAATIAAMCTSLEAR